MICHRVNTPEEIIVLAGTRKAMEYSSHYATEGATGEGSARIQHQFKIDPNKVRALPPGHAYAHQPRPRDEDRRPSCAGSARERYPSRPIHLSIRRLLLARRLDRSNPQSSRSSQRLSSRSGQRPLTTESNGQPRCDPAFATRPTQPSAWKSSTRSHCPGDRRVSGSLSSNDAGPQRSNLSSNGVDR